MGRQAAVSARCGLVQVIHLSWTKAARGGKEAASVKSDPKIYKPGQWVFFGTVLGAFLGLLVGKFALGLIFGFFVGIFIDSAKRKSTKGTPQKDADDPGNA